MVENAREFRGALATDLNRAAALLVKHPALIDYPVFGSAESALHFFATENRPDIVSWLLEHGAKPNGIADDDFPLHAAAQLGHLQVCQALILSGADPNLRDWSEETALHKASRGGYIEIIRALLAAGADPTITEMCGETPVDQALPRKHDAIRAELERHAECRKDSKKCSRDRLE